MKILLFSFCLLVAGCYKNPDVIFHSTENKMLSFKVLSGNDTINAIIGDSSIELLVKSDTDRMVAPVFTYEGVKVMVNNTDQVSGVTIQDFRKKITYNITAKNGTTRYYRVQVKYFTGLPIWKINTNGLEIPDKINYVTGDITLDGNTDSIVNYKMGIRGRGNSTWGKPKNPYKIKFNNKESVLGFPADKEWAILANWFDKSLLRNDVGFELSERLNRAWTPRRKLIDVFLNNKYNGNYLLTETIKSGKDRVNIDTKNGGWLIEINHNYQEDDPRIWIADAVNNYETSIPADVKEGSISPDSILNQMNTVYAKLKNRDFDPVSGYQKEFDLDAYVSWYLVNEVMINNDASFYSSVFVQKDNASSKIKMGPVWDFDLSSGNVNYGHISPEGWYIANAEFANQIWLDPLFQKALKEKWNKHRSEIFSVLDYIDQQAKHLKTSQVENFKKWDILVSYVPPNVVVAGTYQGEVEYFKSWLYRRIQWMDSQINK